MRLAFQRRQRVAECRDHALAFRHVLYDNINAEVFRQPFFHIFSRGFSPDCGGDHSRELIDRGTPCCFCFFHTISFDDDMVKEKTDSTGSYFIIIFNKNPFSPFGVIHTENRCDKTIFRNAVVHHLCDHFLGKPRKDIACAPCAAGGGSQIEGIINRSQCDRRVFFAISHCVRHLPLVLLFRWM